MITAAPTSTKSLRGSDPWWMTRWILESIRNSPVSIPDHAVKCLLIGGGGAYGRVEEIINNLNQALSNPAALHREMDRALNEKAKAVSEQLCRYYATHPELEQYTLKRELPRMLYVLRLSTGSFVVNKRDICEYVTDAHCCGAEAESVLWRSANQSLFADAIEVITKSTKSALSARLDSAMLDGIGVVASQCVFLVDNMNNMVSSRCKVEVSLPFNSQSGRLVILSLEIAAKIFPLSKRLEMRCVRLEADSLGTAQILETTDAIALAERDLNQSAPVTVAC